MEYTDVARFASQAFWNALLENEQEARLAAEKAAEKFGLGERMAHKLVEDISHQTMEQAQRSADSW